MFELVVYKGKKYIASVMDLMMDVNRVVVLDTLECIGTLSKDFDKTNVYDADPSEVCTVEGDEIKEVEMTGKYFLYKEHLDGFGGTSVYVDCTALMEQMEQYKKDITPDNFIDFAHFHTAEIDLAYEFKDYIKRLEEYKKGNDNG